MKIDTSNVKRGVILKVDDNLMRVLDISHTHTGRWSATYTFRVKNVVTWWTNNLTYKSWTTLEQAEVNVQNAVYLYNSWDTYSFMENDTSEIHDLDAEDVQDVVPYLKENMDVFLMMHEWKILWVILPKIIIYKIIQTVPGVKWDRSSAGKKPATLETWLEVMVPLHLSEWDEVRINTETWDIS